MKKLLLIFLLLPSIAFAGHRPSRHQHVFNSPPAVSKPLITVAPAGEDSTAPTPVVLIPVQTGGDYAPAGGWCMNIGYEPINGSYDIPQETIWLNELKAANINCVHLAFYGTNASVTKPLALLAKSLGFYVEIGNDGAPTDPSYAQGVIAEAQWAQANGIDQISIGNEADAGGTNQPLFASLSCLVRQNYSGVISYDTYKGSYDPITSWAGNMGCLDKLGLNLYADFSNTLSEAQHYLPGHFYVSETNIDRDAFPNLSDSDWATQLQNILNIEKQYGVKINVFAFVAGGDGVNTHWGMLGHSAVMQVLGL